MKRNLRIISTIINIIAFLILITYVIKLHNSDISLIVGVVLLVVSWLIDGLLLFYLKNNSQDYKLKKDKMIKELRGLLVIKNAELIEFDYNPEAFGNIVIKIIYFKKTHTFIIDRGEIYHNSNLICNGSYHVPGQDDSFKKLLEVIDNKLI